MTEVNDALSPEQRAAVRAMTPQPAEPQYDGRATAVPPDVRVRLRWRYPEEHRGVLIESTHRIPNKTLVFQELTTTQRALIPTRYKTTSSYYDLSYAINATAETIPLQVWADAISAATIRGLAATTAVSAESVLGSLLQTGYMAIGGSILKITPVAHVGSSKAMAAIKRQAVDQAKAEADQIRNAATNWATTYRADAEQAARTILDNAQRERTEAKRQLEAAKRAGLTRPPDWLMSNRDGSGANLPIKLAANRRWCVGIPLSLHLSAFEFQGSYRPNGDPLAPPVIGRLTWQGAVSEHDYVRVFIWQPIDDSIGTYNPRQAYIDANLSEASRLPHMNTNGSCLGLADGPELLNSVDAYQALRSSVLRVHEGVNFASLLCQPSLWKKYFKPWIPTDLWDLLTSDSTWMMNMVQRLQTANQPPIDTNREAAGVWHT